MEELKAKIASIEAVNQAKRERKLKLEAELKSLQEESDAALDEHNKKIAELRRKLNNLKETGEDEDIPRVDKELEAQIQKIVSDNSQLKIKNEMLEQAIKLVKSEIDAKDYSIQCLTLKTKPTPKILANPTFQTNQLLLEEIVLQNQELRKTFSDISDQIMAIQEENQRIRADIQSKQ